MDKNALLNIVDETKNIVEKNNLLTPELDARFADQRRAVENFRAKILFVGAFNAGKSALINAFLGKYVLEENIRPETAVATEVTAEEIPDLVLVDMPGFDSGIEAHNRALVQYIGEAAAYVFVIDVTEGNVGESSLQFLDELKSYSRFFRFVLTKTDKIPPSRVAEIAEHIGDQLESELGARTPLTITSNRDPKAHDKLKSLLDQFPADRLMLEKLGGEILSLLNRSIELLRVQADSLDLDTSDLDRAIRERESQKIKLEEEFAFRRNEFHERFQNENVNRILNDADAALRNNIGSLVAAVGRGGDAFGNRVNSILRPVLSESARVNVNDSFNQLAGGFGGGANAIFKVVSTSFAVLTEIIAPWMELVIIFLPELVNVLRRFFGRADDDEIRAKLELEIIPSICERLRPSIQQSMTEVEAQMIFNIEREFQSAIENEIAALERLKEEKTRRALDVESEKISLERDIEEIKLRAERIETTLEEV